MESRYVAAIARCEVRISQFRIEMARVETERFVKANEELMDRAHRLGDSIREALALQHADLRIEDTASAPEVSCAEMEPFRRAHQEFVDSATRLERSMREILEQDDRLRMGRTEDHRQNQLRVQLHPLEPYAEPDISSDHKEREFEKELDRIKALCSCRSSHQVTPKKTFRRRVLSVTVKMLAFGSFVAAAVAGILQVVKTHPGDFVCENVR